MKNINNEFIINDFPNIKDVIVKSKDIINIAKDGVIDKKTIYYCYHFIL